MKNPGLVVLSSLFTVLVSIEELGAHGTEVYDLDHDSNNYESYGPPPYGGEGGLGDVTRFGGMHNFLLSFIAMRELMFLGSLAAIMVAGNLVLAFLQLPSYFLPVHQLASEIPAALAQYGNTLGQLFTFPGLQQLITAIGSLPLVPVTKRRKRRGLEESGDQLITENLEFVLNILSAVEKEF